MLSGGDDEDHVNRLKSKCLIVSNIANKLAPMMDAGTVCESFSQNWWKRIKNADLSKVEKMEFEVHRDTGEVTRMKNVGHTHDSHTSSTPRAVDMDMLTNLKVYQYTHNTEYYCESANDLVVLLHSMRPEKACSFSIYSFFLQEVAQGCDLSVIFDKLKQTCTWVRVCTHSYVTSLVLEKKKKTNQNNQTKTGARLEHPISSNMEIETIELCGVIGTKPKKGKNCQSLALIYDTTKVFCKAGHDLYFLD